MVDSKKTVSLILGSGGARGLAHIGVIQWLEENGYLIRSISGCSMGALIGGVYAAGKLDVFTGWVRAITRTDMLKLLDISFGSSGMVKGEKIISPHFSPGSRKQAQDSCSQAPLWSEKRSNGYGLSEEQAYGHED